MKINNLIRAIECSEKAYQLYLTEKKYFQANRIYNANKFLYKKLQKFLVKNNVEELNNEIYLFLFHLDDWFLQFKHHSKTVKDLSDLFVFERITNGIGFPKDFKENLKKYNL